MVAQLKNQTSIRPPKTVGTLLRVFVLLAIFYLEKMRKPLVLHHMSKGSNAETTPVVEVTLTKSGGINLPQVGAMFTAKLHLKRVKTSRATPTHATDSDADASDGEEDNEVTTQQVMRAR